MRQLNVSRADIASQEAFSGLRWVAFEAGRLKLPRQVDASQVQSFLQDRSRPPEFAVGRCPNSNLDA